MINTKLKEVFILFISKLFILFLMNPIFLTYNKTLESSNYTP
jgi:hypothetical protein